MAVITFKTLNNNLQDSLQSGKVPEKNVIEISERLKAETKKDFKLVVIVMSVVTVMLGGFLAYSMMNSTGMREALLQWIIGFVVLVGVLFFLCYMAFVGIIRIQFNGAVKEGYPELYKKCKV